MLFYDIESKINNLKKSKNNLIKQYFEISNFKTTFTDNELIKLKNIESKIEKISYAEKFLDDFKEILRDRGL